MPNLPFTAEQFFRVFAEYNAAVWPSQVLLFAGALIAVSAAFRGGGVVANRALPAFLAALWTWTALVYHLLHFRSVNPAAIGFAGVFLLQAMLFARQAVRGTMVFGTAGRDRTIPAALVLGYALFAYPVIGALAGHSFLESPTFGAPCPVVIYTFGILLLARPLPWHLLAIPTLWAMLGLSAIRLGVLQDLGLPISALLVLGIRALEARRPPSLDVSTQVDILRHGRHAAR